MITPSFNITATERVLPKLAIDFTSGTIDPRITFTRTTNATNPATYVGSDGLIKSATNNQPRFDYNPTTLVCKGLLIEEQRTNLLQRSEEFDDAYWTKTNATVTANTAVAPGGTLTADKLVATAVSGRHVAFRNIATSASNAFTVSCYAKAGEYGFLALSVMQGSNSSGILYTFNLTDGTATQRAVGGYSGVSAQSQSVGNGWWRCSITFTNAGATADYVIIAPSPSATPSFDASYVTASYTGDGYSGIYIWGAQLEAGAFATSYIPTTTAALTRNADVAVMTGTNFSDWFNASEGTFVSKADTTPFNGALSGSLPILNVNDNTTNNQFGSRFDTGGTNTSMLMFIGGASQGTVGLYNAVAGQNKLAINYKSGNRVGSLNAATVKTGTYTGSLVVDRMRIGSDANGSYLNGTIQQVNFYPQALTNTEMQSISK